MQLFRVGDSRFGVNILDEGNGTKISGSCDKAGWNSLKVGLSDVRC